MIDSLLRRLGPLSAALGALAITASSASALEELKGEKKAISACEVKLCNMLVHKEPKGPDLKCDLTKTWARKTIKGAESSQLSWGFGDARCTVKLNVSRADIVGAMTAKDGKFRLAPQPVDCLVEEGGETRNVRVTVSPKIEFNHGEAKKIWINLVSTDGPSSITSMVRFAIQLEDSLGLFHHALLKSVNAFINKSCPKVLEEEKQRLKTAAAAKAKAPRPEKKSETAAQPAAATPPSVTPAPAAPKAESEAPPAKEAPAAKETPAAPVPAKEEAKKEEPAKPE